MDEFLYYVLTELKRLQGEIAELRQRIALQIEKPDKDEVEQAFDECEKSDDEAADQGVLVP